jgi:hypothetical protein
MKKLETQTITKTTEVVIDVLCNKCGESLIEGKGSGGEAIYGLAHAHVSTGYFSPALGDGNEYEFDLCEKCLKELFKTFKHDPLIGNFFEIGGM